jgi:hypothetical protein
VLRRPDISKRAIRDTEKALLEKIGVNAGQILALIKTDRNASKAPRPRTATDAQFLSSITDLLGTSSANEQQCATHMLLWGNEGFCAATEAGNRILAMECSLC